MEFTDLYLQRRDVLYNFYMEGVWGDVPEDLMRQRPHPRVNSIAWTIWHITRVEDAGLNRFVLDSSQILDEGSWMERMNAPWRHNGTGMSSEDVDEMSRQINLTALHDYSKAVQERTREVVKQLEMDALGEIMQADRVRKIVFDEGLAHSQPDELAANYTGWSVGRCLMTFGLTHPFQHLGEIEVIASLLGIQW